MYTSSLQQSEEGKQALSEKLSHIQEEMKGLREQAAKLQQDNTHLQGLLKEKDNSVR